MVLCAGRESMVMLKWVAALRCTARLAQSVERKALNLVVVGSSPTVGVFGLAVDFRRAHEAARRITE